MTNTDVSHISAPMEQVHSMESLKDRDEVPFVEKANLHHQSGLLGNWTWSNTDLRVDRRKDGGVQISKGAPCCERALTVGSGGIQEKTGSALKTEGQLSRVPTSFPP